MRADLVDTITLVCPPCRQQGVSAALQLDQVLERSNGHILEGFFRCRDCSRRYPIFHGVPVILNDLPSWWRDTRTDWSRAYCTSGVLGDYLDALAPDSGPGSGAGLLATYLEAHYGDRLEWARPRSLPSAADYWDQLLVTAATADPLSGPALDLGCATGRLAFELAERAPLVIGIDLNLTLVAAAAQIQRECALTGPDGQRVDYPAAQNVLFLVADALDPPFVAGRFGQVAALNLLDNVSDPLLLLQQIDALLAAGGQLLLGSPYAWRSDICPRERWLESADVSNGELLRQLLSGRRLPQLGFDYALERERPHTPWALRLQDRAWQLFFVDLLSARKR